LGNARAILCGALFVLSGLAGCGGGGSGGVSPPPPPPPPSGDFTLLPNATTITVQQQGVSQFLTIDLTPVNGFSGSVSVTMSGLPANVTATPGGPFNVSTTNGAVIEFNASRGAIAASTTITLTGTSGSITHTATFNLVVMPEAPFTIQVKPASLSLKPGQLASVQISVTANAGTAPSLLTNVTNPPNGSGVTVNPPQSLLSPSAPVSFSIVAAVLCQPEQGVPLQISASDNAGNTSQVTLPLTVSVPSARLGLTRSSFIGTGNVPTRAVYDSARKLIFATVETMNEVNVYSSTSGELKASIAVEQPVGIDESVDGTQVIVGAQSAYITVIDPNLLEVDRKVRTPTVSNPVSSETDYYFLPQPAALSNGKVLFTAQHGYTSEMHVFLWDPSAGTMTPTEFPESIIYAQTLTRSADHSKVLVYGVSSTGATAALYDVGSGSYIANGSFDGAYYLALSPDGSQAFAAGIQGNATGFYNDSFARLASLTLELFPVSGTLYSRDGRHVYVSGTLNGSNVVASLNAQTYAVEGVVPDVTDGTDATVPFDIDETGLIFAGGASGIALVDLSTPGFYNYPIPSSFQVQPPLLSPTAATEVSLTGSMFDQAANYTINFGVAPGSGTAGKGMNVSVQSQTALIVNAPGQALQGPVNVTLTRAPDGWFEVIPQAATYGPDVFAVAPNAGPPSGGGSVELFGYGLSGPNVQTVIGGKAAQILQTTIPSGPYGPITVTAPSGSPGYAHITVTTPAGSTLIAKGYRYLESANVYPVIGALDAIVYDQLRQRLYATNQPLQRVEIFDLASKAYLAPIPVGNLPSGLAMTPDASLLAVVNAGDGTVSKISLASGQVTATYPALTAKDLSPGCQGAAMSITPVTPHRMIIDGICNAVAFGGLMHLLDLDSGALGCTGFVTCSTNGTDLVIGSGLQAMASTPDGEKVFMTDTSRITGIAGGLVTLIDVAANTAAQNEFGGGTTSAINADGTVFATDFGLHDANNIQFNVISDLLALGAGSHSFTTIPGEELNPSGSLLFVPLDAAPQANGYTMGMDIYDVHRGRLVLRVVFPEHVPFSLSPLALDETGTKMFVISDSGITVASLFQAPLSLGHVTPALSASGTQVTLRGSGFQNGSTVKFGGVTATVNYVDAQTLQVTVPTLPPGPVQVTVTDTDGTSYSFDAAFTVL
jgi:DNA-binding beta-propeller fold protein YncE